LIWNHQSQHAPTFKSFSTFDWWEVEINFRVTGRGRIGADGLAFWFTTTKGFEGPVFGSSGANVIKRFSPTTLQSK
jgi:hypothetical protein